MSAQISNELERLGQITERVCHLQRAHIDLQMQLKTVQSDAENEINHLVLQIIDLLDLLEALERSLESEANASTQLVIKKTKKRLLVILQNKDVKPIVFEDGTIEVGKARVLQTEPSMDGKCSGSIIKICRQGYQCGATIIRPADVITAS